VIWECEANEHIPSSRTADVSEDCRDEQKGFPLKRTEESLLGDRRLE
jgi:hypothetical protein